MILGIIKKVAKLPFKVLRKIKNKIKYLLTYKKRAEKTISELNDEVNLLQQRIEWFKKHTDIMSLKPATGYLRKKQLMLESFANEFFEEIKELELKPFLNGGNLIGAYRHKGYVPWDDDLDFGLIRSDYEKLIEYCKKHYVVVTYNGRWSEYNTDKHIARLDKLVKENPNKYILDIWIDQIQITRGTSCIDRMAIDFWPYDYYADDYSIDDFAEYLQYLDKKKHEIDYIDKIVEFLRYEISTNKNISKQVTSKIFPGIDNVSGYLRMHKLTDWMYTEDALPLKKVPFESSMYYVPKTMEKWMHFEYPNYMEYPSDVGTPAHEGYKEKYIINNMPTVEFYLVDAFEIYHFIPLYYYFEKNGVYASFVAEKPENKDAWFDYDEAIRILDMNGVRYKTTPNYDVDFAFTTQDEHLIGKYKNKKVHLCYGVGLLSTGFCESDRTIKDFDLKIVHGIHSKKVLEDKGVKIDLIIGGYLRYSAWGKREYIYDIEKVKEEIEKKNTSKKEVLLYFPTWDAASSIDAYEKAFTELKEKYFIITKAHHCTHRLASEKRHREVLNRISDILLEGNFSFEQAVSLGNIAVCDAISGASTEVPYLNREIKLILLHSPIKEKNDFKNIINEYAEQVSDPKELVARVNLVINNDTFIEKRKSIMDDFYSPDVDEALLVIKEYIYNNSKHCGNSVAEEK